MAVVLLERSLFSPRAQFCRDCFDWCYCCCLALVDHNHGPCCDCDLCRGLCRHLFFCLDRYRGPYLVFCPYHSRGLCLDVCLDGRHASCLCRCHGLCRVDLCPCHSHDLDDDHVVDLCARCHCALCPLATSICLHVVHFYASHRPLVLYYFLLYLILFCVVLSHFRETDKHFVSKKIL